jgi:hypothetical protein
VLTYKTKDYTRNLPDLKCDTTGVAGNKGAAVCNADGTNVEARFGAAIAAGYDSQKRYWAVVGAPRANFGATSDGVDYNGAVPAVLPQAANTPDSAGNEKNTGAVHLFCLCTDITAQKCGSAHTQQNNKWFQAMVLGPAASATNGDGDSVKANMLYGAALALSGAGDYLAVGAPGATRSSVPNVGLVFLYKRNAANDATDAIGLFWSRITTAKPSTSTVTFLEPTGTGNPQATGQKFGFSLAFMGTVNQDLRLLVGAPEFGAGTTISPLKEGKVYVYTQDGTSTGGLSDWQASLKTTVAYVNSVNPTSTRKKDALFGASVAGYTDTSPANPDEDASYVFCGAPGDDNDPDQKRGKVYPFKTQIEIGTGLSLKGFAPLGTAALEGEKSDDFGAAVAMVEGNGQVFAAVSAPRSNDDSYFCIHS